MSYIITDNKHYKNIASAIRSKLRVDTKYTPEEMASVIGTIPSSADGTDNPVAGIYYTDPDENGNPTVTKMVGIKAAEIPKIYHSNNLKRGLREAEFINCSFTSIPAEIFNSCINLNKFSVPEGIKTIGGRAFDHCSGLHSIKIPTSVQQIDDYAFEETSLIAIDLCRVVILGNAAFASCTKLTDVFFPNTLKKIGNNLFVWGGSSLFNVILEDNFNCDNLNLSTSVRYTRNTILSWFNALKDRTGETAYTLIIGNTNLKKMTKDEIAIATNKNWIIK